MFKKIVKINHSITKFATVVPYTPYNYVHKMLQETDHICRSYIKTSNGPKFVDPRTSDDRPLFKRSMS